MVRGKIIALGHRKKVGKNTFADFLDHEARCNNTILKKVSFAHRLKEISYNIFGWAGLKKPEYYEAHPEEKDQPLKIGVTPRQIWLKIGQMCRELYPDVWIELALEECTDPKVVYVITDLRYPNEADAIRARGGYLIRIDRKAAPVESDGADEKLADYTKWDRIIKNDGELKDLYKEAITCLTL